MTELPRNLDFIFSFGKRNSRLKQIQFTISIKLVIIL